MVSKYRSAGKNMLVAGFALLASQSAFADNIQLQGWWGGAGNVSLTLTNGVNYHTGTTGVSFTEAGGAGGFRTLNATTNEPTFESWCVDIFHNFSFGNPGSTVNVKVAASSIFGTNKAEDLGRLFTRHHTVIDGHNSTNSDSAAFQLAVWEIVNETTYSTYSLSSGAFKASGTGAGTAQAWLLDLNSNHAASMYRTDIWSVTNNTFQANGRPTWGAQDVAVFAPIPEPDTYAMMLAGLGLIGFIARRRTAGEQV
jgi:PEP-CTERM motif